jgi:hypothetical protein
MKMSEVGKLVRLSRELLGLRRQDVLQRLGYKNMAKGHRRLQHLETDGQVAPQFLARVQALLNIDTDELRQASQTDDARRQADWNAWADQPVPIRLVVKWFPGLYLDTPLPENAQNDETLAMDYARQFAKDKGVSVCLVLSRRDSAWITAAGELLHKHRTSGMPGEPPKPFTSVRGRPIPLESP